MRLTHEFDLAMTPDEAWDLLTDVERIAPCMPGAFLTSMEGDEFSGGMKVKIGPITASYAGAARFVDLDRAAKRAVLHAEGRETKGNGTAKAAVTMTLSGDRTTSAEVTTDLNISGRLAQFGRGVIVDISSRILRAFVDNLETLTVEQQVPRPSPSEASQHTVPTAREARDPAAEAGAFVDVAAESWPDAEEASSGAPVRAPLRDGDDPAEGMFGSATGATSGQEPGVAAAPLDLNTLLIGWLGRYRSVPVIVVAIGAGFAWGRRSGRRRGRSS